MAEVALADLVHAVVVEPGVKRVAHQHGVVDRRHPDAVAGQHLHVVLGVVVDLEDGGVFQQRLEKCQAFGKRHLVRRQLVRAEETDAAFLAVGEGDVGRVTRLDGEADADEFGLHLIEARRFGIDRDPAGGVGLVDPRLKLGGGGDAGVILRVEGQVGRAGKAGVGGVVRQAARGGGLGFGDGGNLDAQLLGHAAGDGAKFHLREEIEEVGRDRLLHLQRVEVVAEVHLAIEADELLREADLVGMVDQHLPALRLLDLFSTFKKRFEVAVFVDEKSRGLDADAGRAGDVVDAVAGQRLHVDDALGVDAELLEYALAIDAGVLHRVEHLDPVADELHQVLVGGHDGDAPTRVAGLAGEGGDDVVGLEAFLFEAGEVEGARRFAGQRDLRAQILGHRLAVGLVEVVHLVAEGVRALVEDDGGMGGRVGAAIVLDHLPDHVDEARDRTDRQAIGLARERRQRVVGSEDEGRAVDQAEVMSLAECHACPPFAVPAVLPR